MIRLILAVAVVFSLYSLNTQPRRPLFNDSGAGEIQGWPLVHRETRRVIFDYSDAPLAPFDRTIWFAKCVNLSLGLFLVSFQWTHVFQPVRDGRPSRTRIVVFIALLLFSISLVAAIAPVFVLTREMVFPAFSHVNFNNFTWQLFRYGSVAYGLYIIFYQYECWRTLGAAGGSGHAENAAQPGG